jgi:integrase
MRLRVKDLDFGQRQILVRDGKGQRDRITMMPQSLLLPLQEHLQHVKRLHEQDLARGCSEVYLPDALARKYPNVAWEWIWQYVFPSQRLSGEPVRASVASCGKRNPVFGKHRVSSLTSPHEFTDDRLAGQFLGAHPLCTFLRHAVLLQRAQHAYRRRVVVAPPVLCRAGAEHLNETKASVL